MGMAGSSTLTPKQVKRLGSVLVTNGLMRLQLGGFNESFVE